MKPSILIPALALLACSGCVSAKYQSAANGTPPPVALNLTSAPARFLPLESTGGDSNPAAAPPSVAAVVHSVIVYRGPGSWKRNAYWDEYVVSLVNRDSASLVVESAMLTDFRGDTSAPDYFPWPLERQSRLRVDELNQDHSSMIQLGGGMATMVAGSLLGAATLGGGSAAASVWAGGIVGMAAIPLSPGIIDTCYELDLSQCTSFKVNTLQR